MTYLDRNGVAIYYEDHGQAGPQVPLFLTHGYSASAEMWQPNLPALSRHRRVITWISGVTDARFPTDPAEDFQAWMIGDMAAVLDAFEVRSAVVGGLSLGVTCRWPSTSSIRTGSPGRFSVTPDRGRTSLGPSGTPSLPGLETRSTGTAWTPAPAAPKYRPPITSSAAGLALAARGILTRRDSQVIDSLATISVPTLVIVGADDRDFLVPADMMAAEIPGATKVVIDNAGHAVNIDQPEAFQSAVLSFLKEV